MTIEHRDIQTGEQHVVANWVVSSVNALTSLTPTELDIGKQAWVAGRGHYVLAAVSPNVWELVAPTVASATFNADTRVLTLTLTDTSTVTVTVPPGVDSAAVGSLISAALGGYYTREATDVLLAAKVDNAAIMHSGTVIQPPSFTPSNGVSGGTFVGGTFACWNGTAYAAVTGGSTTVAIAPDTIAVTVSSVGSFSAVSSLASTDTVVAWCRAGSIYECVGKNSASSVNRLFQCMRPILLLPVEAARIEEKIDIQVSSTNRGLVYSTTYDVAKHKVVEGTVYYVDVATGSDSADGTEVDPIKSINAAIAKTPLADVIYVKYAAGEDYDRSYGWSSSITNRTLSIIGYGAGRPRLTTVDRFSNVWTLHSAGVYTLSRTQTGGVIDADVVDSYGRPMQLTVVESLAACESTPSSMYFATPNLYIHLHDGREPDSAVKVLLNQNNGRVVDNSVVYLENIEFGYSYRGFHGEVVTAGATSGRVYAKNCVFGMSLTENSFNSYGMKCVLQGCLAEHGWKDGFNVHIDRSGADAVPWAVEIGCEARYCGYDGLSFNNASTYHDGVIGLRINGNYHHAHGRVINDVSEGTVSINIGCYAGDSTWSATSRSCWESGQASTGRTKMYCFGCTTSNDGSQTFIKQGVSELYLFDSPIGVRAQYYGGANPYTFIYNSL